jgi:GT2 family glycosyltransferase
MYLEVVDVAKEQHMGWSNFVVPGARAYHMGSASSSKTPGFSVFYTYRNNAGLLIKNLPLPVLVKVFPKLIRGDIETIKVLYKSNRSSQIKYIRKGRLISLVYLPST